MSDNVVKLVLPREREFDPVAQLVLAGLGARLGLTFESLDDLHLALSELVERDESEVDLVLRFTVGDGVIATEVGPFEAESLRLELERDDLGGVGLRRLLDTMVDSVQLDEDASGVVVRLVKQVGLAPTQS